VRCASANIQAEDNEGRLHEFRRLDRQRSELKPAMRALDLGPDHQRQHHEREGAEEGDGGEAAHLTHIEERDADDRRDGRREEEELPVDEVERRQVNAHGDRRARRKRQHAADEHEAEEAEERPLVDGPPPFGKLAAVRARETDHAVALP
jgi:hypothetical protein